MNNQKILYTLLLIFFIITPVNANGENGIVSQDTKNSPTSNLVYYWQTDDCCSEMEKTVSSQEFQDYLQKNGINKDDYELHLVPSYSDVPLKVIVHTPNQEFHYSITNITTDSSITVNNMQVSPRSSANYFKVANKCGSTLGMVKVAYYRLVTVGSASMPFILETRKSTRYNLANNEVLNYNPSAEFNSATITVFKKSSDWFASAAKIHVPLGNWHTAYVKKDRNYYIQLV